MSRRTFVTIGAGSLAILLVASVAAVAVAEADTNDEETAAWSQMLDDARARAAAGPFSGTIDVDWHDAKGAHHVTLEVEHRDGVVEIVAGPRVVAAVPDGVMVTGDVWTALAGHLGGGRPPLVHGKYRIVRNPGPVVAGRATVRYDAARSRGAVVERMYVDDDTGLVLRRETLDPRGRIVRSVSFSSLRTESGSVLPSVPSTVPHATPSSVADLRAPYRDPAHVGNGFRLLARFKHPSRLAQLFYSDGLLSVSVFEQPGHVDWSSMPAPDATVSVAGHRAQRYALPVGEAWVFQRSGVVYTCVGDVPVNELAAIAVDVSAPHEHTFSRVARLALSPFSW